MGQSRQKWTDRRGTEDFSRTDASNFSCSFGDVLQEGRGKFEKVDVVHGKFKVQEYTARRCGWTIPIVGLMHFMFNRPSTS